MASGQGAQKPLSVYLILLATVERIFLSKTESRPNDARAKRSRQALQRAMLELVGSRSLDDISVRDLCATANLSHPTFYRSYSNKEEILEEIAAEQMRQLMDRMASLIDLRDPRVTARAICDFIEQNRALWTILLTTGATTALRNELVRFSLELARQRPVINPDLPLTMVSGFVAAGLIEVLGWWVRQPEDYPKTDVEQFLERLVLGPTIGPDVFVLN